MSAVFQKLGAALLLALLAFGTTSENAVAAEQCGTRIFGGGRSEPLKVDRTGRISRRIEPWLVSTVEGACHVRRFVGDINLQIELDHGTQWFTLDLGNGAWSRFYYSFSKQAFFGSALSVAGSGCPAIKRRLNPHKNTRESWLAGLDQEGWRKAYPLDPCEYARFYPDRFYYAGNKITVPNDEISIAVRSFEYQTVGAGRRAAVTAAIEIGCVSLRVVGWFESDLRKLAEQKLIESLSKMRIEAVPPFDSQFDRACK